jgi:hypothetical protein
METTNNNQNNGRFAKPCKNGCGKHIRWDTVQNAFFEIDTKHRHICPNWSSSQEKVDIPNRKLTLEQQLYADTIGLVIAQILSLVQEIYNHTFRDTKNDR